MNKITREEFENCVTYNKSEYLWSRIQEAQSSETMDYSELRQRILNRVEQWSNTNIGTIADAVAQEVLPLTVQQGFVPDWSKAPKVDGELPDKAAVFWYWDLGGVKKYPAFQHWHRPAPKMRQKTDEQLLENLVESYFKTDGKAGLAEHDTRLADAWAKVAREMVAGKSIQDLCRAAGIPLEVPE